MQSKGRDNLRSISRYNDLTCRLSVVFIFSTSSNGVSSAFLPGRDIGFELQQHIVFLEKQFGGTITCCDIDVSVLEKKVDISPSLQLKLSLPLPAVPSVLFYSGHRIQKSRGSYSPKASLSQKSRYLLKEVLNLPSSIARGVRVLIISAISSRSLMPLFGPI